MKWTLLVIVLSQFFCTSVWFAGNAIMPDLIKMLGVEPTFVAHLISAVQVGFITGTLVFAILTIADRFSPSVVFCTCATIASLLNLAIILPSIQVTSLLEMRFLTGFFLAGIYPVGMKIASDHFQKGLGKSLGFLVGALVLGTALPYLLKAVTSDLPWRFVIYFTSGLAAVGGLAMIFLVPDGPYRKPGQKINFTAFFQIFRNKPFRSAALGYFGHMWELYAFWAFVPVILTAYQTKFNPANFNVPLLAFGIIAAGGVACVLSGYLSQIIGLKKVAAVLLFLSGLCCVTSPLFLSVPSEIIFITFLLFWGMVVVADSPLFSTMVAQHAPEETRGTSLTIVNCLGFAITIISIQLVSWLGTKLSGVFIYTILGIGPALGLWGLLRKNYPGTRKV